MRINIRLLLAAGFALAACSTPKPSDQDGTDLWFANSRPYAEVLASVETKVDNSLAKDEFHIYDTDGKRVVAGGSEDGIRYGVYALQRAEVLGQAGPGIDIQEKPYYEYRILDHWDNLDDTVERGYAGLSMWEWTSPDIPEARIRKYGELCASVGINGSTLNNVNYSPRGQDSRHTPRIRHHHIPVDQVDQPHHAERAQERRPARPKGTPVVERQG